jgi:hypothetical protein
MPKNCPFQQLALAIRYRDLYFSLASTAHECYAGQVDEGHAPA